MITGFNTDIEYEGVVYHVQTEDKGLETPLILSLVYVGGAILASKRSPYDDLVVAGFDATALAERLNRQHKLICAAITAGRIEDLKRLSQNGGGATAARKNSRKAAKAQPPAVATDSSVPAAGSEAMTEASPTVPSTSAGASTNAAVADTKPAPEVPAASELADAEPAAAAAFARTDAVVSSDADTAAFAGAAARPPGDETKSELPPWFETTAESFATILENVAASEVAQAEASQVQEAEAATVEAAGAEQSRPLPPKDALVAGGATRPAGQFAEGVDSPAFAEAAAPSPAAKESGVTEIIPVEVEGELHVGLMEERDYKAGEIVTLRVRVARGPLEAREAVSDATVTVKILGTEFRPLILTSKTDRDGVAVVHAWLPRFTSGRAAILVRAVHDGFTAEMRRAVRHL